MLRVVHSRKTQNVTDRSTISLPSRFLLNYLFDKFEELIKQVNYVAYFLGSHLKVALKVELPFFNELGLRFVILNCVVDWQKGERHGRSF
jgi:hypothetical protein